MANVSSSNGLEKRPKLRFPGFDEPWKKSEFREFAEVNPKCQSIPEQFYYIDLGSVEDGELNNTRIEDVLSAPSRAQRLLSRNDILFQTVRPYQQNNYLFCEDRKLPTVASTGYAVFRTQYDVQFLYALIHTKHFLSSVLSRCTGTSFPAVSASDIEDIIIWAPSVDEQQEIGELFRLLNVKIRKQKALVEALKKYKRGVIQRVFSGRKGNGKDHYPTWEVSSFGEFFTEQIIKTSNSPDTPLVSLTVEDGITPKTERYYREFLITKEGDNYKAIKPGWFAYNPMNAHLGAIAANHLGYTAAVSGYYNIFSVNETDTISFWEEYLTSYPMLIHYKLIATGSLIEKQRVHYSQFVGIRRCLPSVEEQKHLSKLFEAVNRKIANAESMERQLVRMRVSLLQQLFI